MANKFTMKMIPEVIAGYDIYNGDGDNLVGRSGEMTLATVSNIVAEITGAGIGGTYNAPVIGQYENIEQEIPFRIVYKQLSDLMNPLKPCRINVRGGLQYYDKETQYRDVVPFRYVVQGAVTANNLGSLNVGQPMGSSITVSATYLLLEVGGETLFELDKINGKCVIDGVDVTEKLRKYC